MNDKQFRRAMWLAKHPKLAILFYLTFGLISLATAWVLICIIIALTAFVLSSVFHIQIFEVQP